MPGAGEWFQFNAEIPPAKDEPLLHQSNPVKFDAKEWVRIAKDAGMKYFTITTSTTRASRSSTASSPTGK